MDKILITVYVLAIEEEYDLFLPIGITMTDALNRIQNTIVEMSEGNYVFNPSPVLYRDEDGKIINMKNIVKFSGLKNGCKVLLK